MALRVPEPILKPTPILDLRPTQITLGMREVTMRRQRWAERNPEELNKFLAMHMVPVILGPGKALYLIDHHHLARALYDQGVPSVFVTVISDLSMVDSDLFWNTMEFHGWAHPFDAKGRRRPASDLPRTVKAMRDDPYRSLAGELRNDGGFAKEASPFAEFLWADFLRSRIKPKAIARDFDTALARARELAMTPEADYLPGWCAPRTKAAAKAAAKLSRKRPKPEETPSSGE